jgi:hypothetical protein
MAESKKFALYALRHRGIADSENKAPGDAQIRTDAAVVRSKCAARETIAQALNFPGNFSGHTKKAPIGRLSC